MARARRLLAIPMVVWATAGVVAIPVPATAAPQCAGRIEPGQVVAQTPVEQLILAPGRVWPTTTGQGVTVAVVDTGVHGGHPQLRGAVVQGWDFAVDEPGGTVDCAGQGTAVASLIAARPAEGIGFAGIAPGATILPVRVAERVTGDVVEPARLAAAIRFAADNGARVINVSVVAARHTAGLRSAVAYAQSRDALVVAAAGSRTRNASDPTTPDPPSYPAGYPGVLGVGAVDQAGERLPDSPIGSHVDIVAPGKDVLAAALVRGHAIRSGTAVATAAVSASAALLRAAFPALTAVEVERRLRATVNPVPGGTGSVTYGHGMVDPYRAVTEVLSGGEAPGQAGLPARDVDVQAERRAAWWRSRAATAVAITMAVGTALAGCAAVVAIHRQLRRRSLTTPGDVDGELGDEDLAERYFSVPEPPRPS